MVAFSNECLFLATREPALGNRDGALSEHVVLRCVRYRGGDQNGAKTTMAMGCSSCEMPCEWIASLQKMSFTKLYFVKISELEP